MNNNLYILGTRGIPNKYGGFEEFAEQMYLFSKSDNDTNIIVTGIEKSNFSNTKYFKPISFFGEFVKQIIYDTIASVWVIFQPKGTIYHCGYGSAFLGIFFIRITKLFHSHKIILNIDGLEWKRSKFNLLTRGLVKVVEAFSIYLVDTIVADNGGINKYITKNYNKKSKIIAYGSHIEPTILFNDTKFNNNISSICRQNYDLVIARIEPENNIDKIILSYNKSNRILLIIGNHSTNYGDYLKSISTKNIIWGGAIYEKYNIEFLRQNCQYYIHGHSVGGTNPSLLQAMASECKLLMHNNDFNKEVALGLFWNSHNDLAIIHSSKSEINFQELIENNLQKIKTIYSWKNIYNETVNLI
jgi:hypothetical protein